MADVQELYAIIDARIEQHVAEVVGTAVGSFEARVVDLLKLVGEDRSAILTHQKDLETIVQAINAITARLDALDETDIAQITDKINELAAKVNGPSVKRKRDSQPD